MCVVRRFRFDVGRVFLLMEGPIDTPTAVITLKFESGRWCATRHTTNILYSIVIQRGIIFTAKSIFSNIKEAHSLQPLIIASAPSRSTLWAVQEQAGVLLPIQNTMRNDLRNTRTTSLLSSQSHNVSTSFCLLASF